MIKILLFVLGYLLMMSCLYAQTETAVFSSGKEGYESYRIPAMISLPSGDILAFCEGRKHNAADFGDIDIVMRRSKDKGKTWRPLQLVVDYDSLQAGNPAPVLDLSDPNYPTGRIFLFYNTGNKREGEIRKGHGTREAWYITSVNGGQTWSAPANITSEVHRPKQPAVNTSYNFPKDWRNYANTPGHAMQFSHGRFKGRIYVAANHSAGEPQPHFTDYKAHGYYSDDHGKTFHLGEVIAFPGGNESMAAQLSGDTLMMNIRNQHGNIKQRIVAISSNGGESWDTTYYDAHLPDPVCQGSLLSWQNKKGQTILAFCNDADTVHRDNLTLRLSQDNGRSWYRNRIIAKSISKKERYDYSAYSDMVLLSPETLGILYEKKNYSEIVFTIIDIK